MRPYSSFLILLLVALVSGCGSKKPSPVQVSGNVTIDDNKPLSEGEIVFGVGGEVPVTIPIKDGKYEGMATPGSNKVQILAYKEKAPPKSATLPGTTKSNYIPERYNAKSKLKAEVKAEGENKFDFQVKMN